MGREWDERSCSQGPALLPAPCWPDTHGKGSVERGLGPEAQAKGDRQLTGHLGVLTWGPGREEKGRKVSREPALQCSRAGRTSALQAEVPGLSGKYCPPLSISGCHSEGGQSAWDLRTQRLVILPNNKEETLDPLSRAEGPLS